MTREQTILKYIDIRKQGIEVAPYFRPIVAKGDGHPVLVLDVFDADKLREMALGDGNLLPEWADRIEPVDIVGDASNIGPMMQERGLAGKIAYIVSSHNFEHLPNPIKFLRGCSTALEVGGVLSMAVPDCRACFDHFRTPTRLSDWLGAYHRDDKQPNPETLLDFWANQGAYVEAGKNTVGCDIQTGQLENFIAVGNLQSAYDQYLAEVNHQSSYIDAHCTVMFPETLELLLRDCAHLGLIDLEIIEVSQTVGLEFYVHLRKTQSEVTLDSAAYLLKRQDLLRLINMRLGAAPYLKTHFGPEVSITRRYYSNAKIVSDGIKSRLRKVFGEAAFLRVQAANRARLAKRHNR
jgi:hypothetical protein